MENLRDALRGVTNPRTGRVIQAMNRKGSSMPPSGDRDDEIIDSWYANAAAWIELIERGGIPSRVAVTDRAIVDAVRAYAPARVLDVGRGEGWLVRRLEEEGIATVGIDAVPALIERARAGEGGRFELVSYEDLGAGRHPLTVSFDAATCNFSLFGEDIVPGTLAALGDLLVRQRLLFVQTLHPRIACGDQPYVDGWREGSRAGCGLGFDAPLPWYFRTIDSWLDLLDATGFTTLEVREPRAAGDETPSSILFVGRAR